MTTWSHRNDALASGDSPKESFLSPLIRMRHCDTVMIFNLSYSVDGRCRERFQMSRKFSLLDKGR